LACLPPWQAVPFGAYAAVALLLLGGISLVPQVVGLLLRAFRGARHPVVALAVARALDQRHTATAAVAGVVASLSLVVALTVMVTSFRLSLENWLGDVLPADLYVRPDAEGGPSSALLSDGVVAAVPRLQGVQRVRAERLVPISLAPGEPEVTLIARDIPPGELPDLPWITAPHSGAPPMATGVIAVYPSEVLAALRHLRVGAIMEVPLPTGPGNGTAASSMRPPSVRGTVRGIWRDYARQQGALLIDRADWLRLTADPHVSDLAVWLAPTANPETLPNTVMPPGGRARGRSGGSPVDITAIERSAGPDAPVEVATTGEIRALSLRIFDRSFAVTRWLQGVALAIGLAGIAASFSAQVLARRREFGTLQHLGFTRRQVLWLVALEGALWSAVGAVLGLALGLGVSVVLVDVVNPQSFHWTMTLAIPGPTLLLLALGVVAAGALTAWGSGHAAAGRDVLRAVHEDW
ncbi:MAG TPA: ABC transporter permease, partial [Burkholderiaceae bacterium]|nr:ABC transporter permease [Burkholderiaceae bacterium]